MLRHIYPADHKPIIDPPANLKKYLERDFSFDWVPKDNFPEELRDEYDKWHEWYLDEMDRKYYELIESIREEKRQRKLNEPWHSRMIAMLMVNRHEIVKGTVDHDLYYGLLLSKIPEEEFTDEYILAYYEDFWNARNAWLKEVERQESIPGYLPENFKELNFQKFRNTHDIPENITDDDMNRYINEYIEHLENMYQKARKEKCL